MTVTFDNGDNRITLIVSFPAFMNAIRHIQESFPDAEKSYAAIEYFADQTVERHYSLPKLWDEQT